MIVDFLDRVMLPLSISLHLSLVAALQEHSVTVQLAANFIKFVLRVGDRPCEHLSSTRPWYIGGFIKLCLRVMRPEENKICNWIHLLVRILKRWIFLFLVKLWSFQIVVIRSDRTA